MVGEWRRVRLGDLIRIKHGWPFQSEFFSLERHDRPIVVSIGNFQYTGGFRFDSTAVKEYAAEYPQEYELHPNDMLLVMTCQTSGGEILGIPGRIPDDGKTYLHNQRMGLVQTNTRDIDSSYLYWVFLSRRFNQHLVATASGTKILHTAPSRIESYEFDLPPLAEQRAIAHILGTLDDKIVLNRRMNQTLEAMARALFKSWFVDFDPVRAKMEGRAPGLPKPLADLFPSRFVNSELGDIPEGWRIGSILDQARLLSGGTPKTDVPAYWDGGIPWASAKDVSQCGEAFLMATERTITTRGLEESATQIIPALSTVVVARGATTGRMALLGRDMAMNQTCYGLAATTRTPSALYCRLRHEIDALVHAAHGSVFDTITTKTFSTAKVIVVPTPLLRIFEERAEAIFLRLRGSTVESRALFALRDALLPRLISGELRVKDAARRAEKVA